MIDPLLKVAVMKPGNSLKNADPDKWNYGPQFNPKDIEMNHNNFIHILKEFGVEIYWIKEDDRGIADAVFTYDASLMTKYGVILMSPGKLLRSGEQHIHHAFFKAQNIPIIGAIKGKGRVESGDTLWLDDNTLIVCRGFRTNQIGVDQLKNIVSSIGVPKKIILSFSNRE